MTHTYLASLREALWLQSDPGLDWWCEEEEDRDASPVNDDDIIDYVAKEFVYSEAGRWTNSRIRAYIDRSARTD